jgi:hypothetical protein
MATTAAGEALQATGPVGPTLSVASAASRGDCFFIFSLKSQIVHLRKKEK